jgi:general stress protein YciG
MTGKEVQDPQSIWESGARGGSEGKKRWNKRRLRARKRGYFPGIFVKTAPEGPKAAK